MFCLTLPLIVIVLFFCGSSNPLPQKVENRESIDCHLSVSQLVQ